MYGKWKDKHTSVSSVFSEDGRCTKVRLRYSVLGCSGDAVRSPYARVYGLKIDALSPRYDVESSEREKYFNPGCSMVRMLWRT